ncbi:glycoside hydrolase family 16 protein [Sclerotinia borealis F-4128]|uniref:endo-1,3(4)-beta-glucanase n=1 Tax=Sclerotinia borealis (strain F-4128) TaxID=1432307 RepID=W9CQU2_SCLBF|nr:glycoside hydrolase family 16 protein [Sclerotinia borealis F-4128]
MKSFCPISLICMLSFTIVGAYREQCYNLDTKYEGSDFFTGWDFFTGSDPTHGYVTYVDEKVAKSAQLITANDYGPAYIGVDYTTPLDTAGPGRKSVRIASQKSWTHGLFIADISHMPGGICGTWPAFWLLGPNWPNNGEIDIIEGVNQQSDNLMSLHTSANCTMPNEGTAQLGTMNSNQCDGTLDNYAGCSSTAQTGKSTYGKSFNSNGGGVYATEWTPDHINNWFFPRNAIPLNIHRGAPEPRFWPKPQAIFQGSSSCNIDTHFANQSLVFDTTFCGDFAGGVWENDGGICSQGGTLSCEQFVAGNPGAFKDAYWLINSVKVYQLGERPVSLRTLASTSTIAATHTSSSSKPQITTQISQVSDIPTTDDISKPTAISRLSSPSTSTFRTIRKSRSTLLTMPQKLFELELPPIPQYAL